MGSKTAIEWCGCTFNCWRGCQRVSEGCRFCFAETQSKRNPGTLGVWGPSGTRVVAAESYWRLPERWNREAAKDAVPVHPLALPPEAIRPRVFVGSMMDWAEDWENVMRGPHGGYLHHAEKWQRKDAQYVELDDIAIGKSRVTMADVRRRMFATIDATPHLDWLLVTKRPENARQMLMPWLRDRMGDGHESPDGTWRHGVPVPNLWLLTSVEDQDAAAERIPHLLACRDIAPVLGLSVEPLIGPVDLSAIKTAADIECNALTGVYRQWCDEGVDHPASEAIYEGGPHIDFVICGGESGPNARPMHPDWVRSIRDQCQAAGVPFFFKQWGEWAPIEAPFRYTPAFGSGNAEYGRALRRFARDHGATRLVDDVPEGWSESMWRHGCPIIDGERAIGRVGKKAAGRLLDGREWSEFPATH